MAREIMIELTLFASGTFVCSSQLWCVQHGRAKTRATSRRILGGVATVFTRLAVIVCPATHFADVAMLMYVHVTEGANSFS